MFRSLANNNFLAIFLCQRVAGQILDLVTSEGTPYLFNLVDRVFLTHAERFDCKDRFCIPWICESPNISEPPGCESSMARLAERVMDRV